MKVHLQYGREGLDVEIPGPNVTVVEPRFVPGLADEVAAFRKAVRRPIGAQPLREVVKAGDRVAVVIPDLTRPLPSDRLLPWLFEELSHVPAERFVIVNGTGSHRVNTPEELLSMVGREVLARYRLVNHTAHDLATMAPAGKSRDGETVYLNREYVEADRRIVLGFIEPHFMAGFSGGYKGIFPAVADIASIMRYHDARTIGDPRSTWGLLEGNPTQAIIRRNGSLLPLDFCVNVTLNRRREITRFFCGDPIAAHEAGCAFSKETAMVACERPFPIVVTTNSGYPLDQNLYQTVKGMSAAAQIVEPGGLHRDRLALRRRLPGARQLQEAALRPRLAARGPGHDRGAGFLPLRPVGGAAARAHPAEGAGGAPERARRGGRAPCVSRADRGRGSGRRARAGAGRKERAGGRAAGGPADDTLRELKTYGRAARGRQGEGRR